jgi:hypothetical protein
MLQRGISIAVCLWIAGLAYCAPPAPGVPDIQINRGGTVYNSGSTYDAGQEITNAATGKSIVFTIVNNGNGPLNLSSASISGAHAADYSTTQPSPLALGAGEAASLTVVFTPGVAGTRNATLTVSSDDPEKSSYPINLTGEGGPAAARLLLRQNSVSYASGSTFNVGSVQENTSGTPVTITMENTGSIDLTFVNSPVIAKAGANAAYYTIGQPSNALLAAGDTRTFTVTFSPALNDNGSKTAFITIDTNDAGAPTYTLNLTGTSTPEPQPQVQVQQGSTDYTAGGSLATFGVVWPTETGSAVTITVRNIGQLPMNITGAVRRNHGRRRRFANVLHQFFANQSGR